MAFGHVQEHTGYRSDLCACVSLCAPVSERQKDKEGEFNGVSQGEAA